MNKYTGCFLVMLMCTLVACSDIQSHMGYEELSDYKAKMHLGGENNLIIMLDSRPGLVVYEIVSAEKDGNIYLSAHRISSGKGGEREYKISLPWRILPADVLERIYWVDPDGSSSRLSPEYL